MGWRAWSVSGLNCRASEYWRDVVCRTVLDVELKLAAQEAFVGRLSHYEADDCRFINFRSSSHTVVRTPRLINEGKNDLFMVSLQLRGIARKSSDEVQISMKPGDIAILDSSRPFSIDFVGEIDRRVVLIPRSVFQSHAPFVLGSPLHKLARRQYYSPLLREYILAMTSSKHQPDRDSAKVIVECFVELLKLATRQASSLPQDDKPRSVNLADARSYISEHLSNPELSPRIIARELGISVRSLYLLFARSNLTVERTIIDERLDACRKALTDADCANESITSIAYGCGFNDVAHFSRRFRMRFGISPSRWRAAQPFAARKVAE